jgi:hypothetical protein
LAALLGGPDFGGLGVGPIYWPDLSPDEYGEKLRELAVWVGGLQVRYPEMVTLPLCWWKHNSIIELLSTMREHEQFSYSRASPPPASASWQLIFRDLEARLRDWIRMLRCNSDYRVTHDHLMLPTQPPDGLADWLKERSEQLTPTGEDITHGDQN